MQSQALLEQLEVLAPTPRARRTTEAARRAAEAACAAQPPPFVPRTKYPAAPAAARLAAAAAAPAAATVSGPMPWSAASCARDDPLLLATSFGYAAFTERLAVPGALKHPPRAARGQG